MAKAPNIDIPLSKLDKTLLDASPFFKIVPLKVRMTFNELTEEALEDLKEYANVEDGTVERWLLVPDRTPLGVLSSVISRAFGLIPLFFGSFFSIEDDDWERICPNLETYLNHCGDIFETPPDSSYCICMEDLGFGSRNMIPPLIPSLMMPCERSYEESQSSVWGKLGKAKKDGISVDGKNLPLSKCPPDLDLLSPFEKGDEYVFSDNLSPDLQIKDVLTTKGRKKYSLDERPKGKRRNMTRWAVKPFVDKLLMSQYTEEGFEGFLFEITMEDNVYPLMKEGYLTVDEYLDSLKYVIKNSSPDCIYKKGYDLFGPDQVFYYQFIMAIHGEDAEEVLDHAKMAGWREPYIDVKKILR